MIRGAGRGVTSVPVRVPAGPHIAEERAALDELSCITIWLGSSRGWDWNFTPIQP
jgi:hypothetical protein